MSLPEVTFEIEDGALGQVPASDGTESAKIGVCSDGIVGQINGFSDMASAQSTLGQGKLVDATAHTLGVPGHGVVYTVPINPSVPGSASAVAHTGPGVGVVTVAFAPRVPIVFKITTGGTIGTMAFAVSINGGAFGTPIVYATPYAIPGTLTTVTFAAGTYVLNDLYTLATDGTVALTGSGPPASNVTHASNPLDDYAVLLTVKTTGAAGTGQFSWSLDGGNDGGHGDILIPSGGRYQMQNTGVVLVFSSTFTALDTYSFTTQTSGFGNSDVTAACGVLLGSSFQFAFLHLVGAGASAAAAAATAAILDTQMTVALTQYRFIRAVMECPIVEADATIVAALESFASTRVALCVGDAALVSPLNGRILRRNSAWVATARAASISSGTDPAWVALGRLPNVFALYPNFGQTTWNPTLLDAGRFTTLRQFQGEPGYFVSNMNTMAPPGSDYTLWQRARVMDVACTITRRAELPYLSGAMRVDPTTGFIDERDAQAFENEVNAQLKAALVDSRNASKASVVVDRTTNVLSTNETPVEVRVTPLHYNKRITNRIGFSNPAIQV